MSPGTSNKRVLPWPPPANARRNSAMLGLGGGLGIAGLGGGGGGGSSSMSAAAKLAAGRRQSTINGRRGGEPFS